MLLHLVLNQYSMFFELVEFMSVRWSNSSIAVYPTMSPLSSCNSSKWSLSLKACIIIFFVAAYDDFYLFQVSCAIRWISSALCVVPPYAPGMVGNLVYSATAGTKMW